MERQEGIARNRRPVDAAFANGLSEFPEDRRVCRGESQPKKKSKQRFRLRVPPRVHLL